MSTEIIQSTNKEQLAARRAAMPIIDIARVPWRVLRDRSPRTAFWVFLWLRLLRPAVVTLFWVFLLRYAWLHLFGLPDDLPLWQQIALYAIAVVGILGIMLVLAPLRERELDSELPTDASESTFSAISELADVPEHELKRWQHTQRLVVQHDDEGSLQDAETDLMTQPVSLG